jgi:hypothetical protein
LDSKCRCAVIVHELSHLRRRDHRLCWAEGLIGLFYWWHPVFWWARRRLRDEAEACCDAWVTTLLPGGRRAYAEALVATKSFLSVPGHSGAPGLGVISGRTRQLARRVTMVMTQRVAPRASILGLAFAVGIGAAGIFVMPGLACPPEDEKPAAKTASMKEKAAKDKAKAEKRQAEADFLGEAPALEAMKLQDKTQSDQAAGLKAKLEVLQSKERALKEMEVKLREMEKKLQQMQRQGDSKGAGQSAGPGRAMGPVYVLRSQPGVTLTTPGARDSVTLTPYVTRVAPAAPQVAAMGGENTVERAYELPEGKLEALVGLMSRSDVPIFVHRDGNKIFVQASPRQHEVFGAFVRMINPDGASPATGAVGLAAPRAAVAARGASNRALAETLEAQGRAEAARARAGDARARNQSVQQEAQNLRQWARALEAQQKDSARQYQQLMKQLEKLHEQIDRIREQQENQRSDNDDDEHSAVDRAASDATIAQLDQMDAKLSELDGLSGDIDSQLDAVLETIQNLNEAADEMPEVPQPPEAAEAPEAPEAMALPGAPVGIAPPARIAPPVSTPAIAPVPALPPAPPVGSAPATAPVPPRPGSAPTSAAPAAPTAPTTPPAPAMR